MTEGEWSRRILLLVDKRYINKNQLIMDNPVIPMIHPLAGEDCSDKVKIVFGEGGKIVDVDSEEAIATIPYGKFGD
jgi:hypothetical protein